MTAALFYLAGALAMMAFILAWREEMRVREAWIAAALWPCVLAWVIVEEACDLAGWNFDVADPRGGWGVRRPADGWPGIAIRCPLFELQLWKRRP